MNKSYCCSQDDYIKAYNISKLYPISNATMVGQAGEKMCEYEIPQLLKIRNIWLNEHLEYSYFNDIYL